MYRDCHRNHISERNCHVECNPGPNSRSCHPNPGPSPNPNPRLCRHQACLGPTLGSQERRPTPTWASIWTSIRASCVPWVCSWRSFSRRLGAGHEGGAGLEGRQLVVPSGSPPPWAVGSVVHGGLGSCGSPTPRAVGSVAPYMGGCRVCRVLAVLHKYVCKLLTALRPNPNPDPNLGMYTTHCASYVCIYNTHCASSLSNCLR